MIDAAAAGRAQQPRLTAPVILLASPIAAWIGYGIARYRLATAAMSLPLVWLFYMAVGLAALPRR